MNGNRTLDDNNPMWTRADFARARPTAEVLGDALAQSLERPMPSLREALSSQSWLMVRDRLAA